MTAAATFQQLEKRELLSRTLRGVLSREPRRLLAIRSEKSAFMTDRQKRMRISTYRACAWMAS